MVLICAMIITLIIASRCMWASSSPFAVGGYVWRSRVCRGPVTENAKGVCEVGWIPDGLRSA